jgi:hypothetical protein
MVDVTTFPGVAAPSPHLSLVGRVTAFAKIHKHASVVNLCGPEKFGQYNTVLVTVLAQE